MSVGIYSNWKIKLFRNGFFINRIHAKYLHEFVNAYGSVTLLTNTIDDNVTNEYVYFENKNVNLITLPRFSKYHQSYRHFFLIKDGIKKLSHLSEQIYVRTPEPFSWLFLIYAKNKLVNYHFTSNPLDVIRKSNNSTIKKIIRLMFFFPEYYLICISAFFNSASCNGPSVLKNIPFFLKGKIKVLIESTISLDEINNKEYKASHINEALKLICVSRLQPAKGLEELIDSLIDYKVYNPSRQFHLTIVGDGPLYHKLHDRVFSSVCKNCISLIGSVENGEPLNMLYRDNDILINPSLSETGPRVVIEGMSEGLVCISTDVGYVRYLLKESPELLSYIIEEDFSAELHRMLNSFYDKPLQYMALSKKSFDISKKYSLTQFVNEVFSKK
ncbi:glycosyltransferase family 4 protein [Citrobacter sp. EC_71]|uniref:glycosyltransferase family 4 protein n=1 Tax=unclassified Citrobacter TaxID=2644389 RepID=UPI0010C99219|nr:MULTISPECIES: glycosyltransferase family 4 protein [unclassified Citrobacter]MBW9353358.1 glycosyltransferase family 4 protein [Citrobacter sp. EC_71]TKV13541.1 glycosyltransferase family 4 protein [Citrobacter sp. wls615]